MPPPHPFTFVTLNGVRILSIIALCLVMASNILILVHDVEAINRFTAAGNVIGGTPSVTADTSKSTTSGSLNDDYIAGSTVPNQPAGSFWAVLNRLLIIGQVIFLILSEIGWPSALFDRFFPVLGKDFGVGALGVMQCLISTAVLSHHVDTFAVASAFFLFSIGCLNMFVGLIWRESVKAKRSVTSWREHSRSALPTHIAGVDVRPVATSSSPSFITSVLTGNSDHNSGPSRSGLGFGRQGEKAAGMKGFLISKPIESLPRYAPKVHPTGNSGSTEFSSTSTAV